jgi:hypothetical protein
LVLSLAQEEIKSRKESTMAAEQFTPIDEIGMPLPLAPTDLERRDASQRKPDWHHHFHPKKSPLLTSDPGGESVRNCREQLYDFNIHHLDYHNHFTGPPLPKTEAQKFGISVLAAAGYVPAKAIQFTDGEPEIVRLNKSQRGRLWSSGELRMASPKKVQDFLLQYSIGHGLLEVDERLIDRFLNTSSDQRRYRLGGILLDLAIDKAAKPLDPFYRTAWKKGYINRVSAHRPQRLIKTTLRVNSRQPILVDKLFDTLASAA